VKRNPGQASPPIPDFALLDPRYARWRIRPRRRLRNMLEGHFNVFKLGMKGIHRHYGEKHLHRHVAEFDFCYNTRSAPGVND
jgi:hypothetical protein